MSIALKLTGFTVDEAGVGTIGRILGLAYVLLWGASCTRSWKAETIQPALELGTTDVARTSVSQVITLADMQLPHARKLANSVYFVVVSKDRLRFHVSLRHHSASIANPAHWRVWLEDSAGRTHRPEGIERLVMKVRSSASWPERARGINRANPQPPSQVTTFQGDGDYTFYERDIYELEELTLVMQRDGYQYRYRWQFVPRALVWATSRYASRRERACARVPAKES